MLAHQNRIATTQAKIDAIHKRTQQQLLTEARKQLATYQKIATKIQKQEQLLTDLKPQLKAAGRIQIEAEEYQRGNVIKTKTGYGEKIGVIYNKGQLPNIAEYDITIPKAGAHQLDIRYAAAASRPVQIHLNGKLVHQKACGKVTGTWYPDSQRWHVEGVFVFRKGKNTIKLQCAGPFPHFDKLAVTPHRHSLIPESVEQIASKEKLNPVFLRQAADTLSLESKVTLEAFTITEDVKSTYPPKIQKQIQTLKAELTRIKKSGGAMPQAMAVTEGAITDLKVHLRGNYLTLGNATPRGVPEILRQVPLVIGKKESGRRQLADWLTSKRHPLTARVMANRIWLGHFGQGLVRSPDNFGNLGERPNHPALLDWLAIRFMKSGWSMKAMHRLIMNSSAYQMSTTYNERASTIDPENRLFWRFHRRRLSAEELRDSLLAISGQLDHEMGGTLMKAKNRTYVPGYPNISYDRYDSTRRSIYLPVIRSDLYKVLQAFDFADPSTPKGRRETTTVAPQALFMLNSKLMQSLSKTLAEKLLKLPAKERLSSLYQLTLGRVPTLRERARLNQFLSQIENSSQAWQSLCRVILASNEFIYLE